MTTCPEVYLRVKVKVQQNPNGIKYFQQNFMPHKNLADPSGHDIGPKRLSDVPATL